MAAGVEIGSIHPKISAETRQRREKLSKGRETCWRAKSCEEVTSPMYKKRTSMMNMMDMMNMINIVNDEYGGDDDDEKVKTMEEIK